MNFLERVFDVFKKSAIYDTYSTNQIKVVNTIFNLYLENEPEYMSEVIRQLEMKLNGNLLSASIPVTTLIELLKLDLLEPGCLELVNVTEEIQSEVQLIEFLNMFVDKCDLNKADDVHQLEYFPGEARKYLTDVNFNKLNGIQ